jgi:hypothetical protein
MNCSYSLVLKIDRTDIDRLPEFLDRIRFQMSLIDDPESETEV